MTAAVPFSSRTGDPTSMTMNKNLGETKPLLSSSNPARWPILRRACQQSGPARSLGGGTPRRICEFGTAASRFSEFKCSGIPLYLVDVDRGCDGDHDWPQPVRAAVALSAPAFFASSHVPWPSH